MSRIEALPLEFCSLELDDLGIATVTLNRPKSAMP